MTRVELEAGNPGFFYLDLLQPEMLAAYLARVRALGPGESMRSATAADGHHEVKLCEAILKSSRTKRWVKA